jgi:hypothetical protein
MHCVFFFGTHDYAWIMETDLKPYMEFKETLNRDKKSGNFKKAIDEIEEFLAGKGNFKTSAGTQAAAALKSSSNSNPEKDAEFDALLLQKKTPAAKTPKRPGKTSAGSDEPASITKKAKMKAADKKVAVDRDVSPFGDSPAQVSILNVENFLQTHPPTTNKDFLHYR